MIDFILDVLAGGKSIGKYLLFSTVLIPFKQIKDVLHLHLYFDFS